MRASTLQKRNKIIEVATKLFLEQGYKATSLDQIVGICGGSKQTLYRYFDNKEGLFIAVLDHNVKNHFEFVSHLSEQPNRSLSDILEDFAVQYLTKICTNPLLGLNRIIASDFNQHSDIPQQYWQNSPTQVHQQLIDFLENAPVCQTLAIEDTPLACGQLLALIKLDYLQLALIGFALPKAEPLRQHARQAVSAFLKLYQQ